MIRAVPFRIIAPRIALRALLLLAANHSATRRISGRALLQLTLYQAPREPVRMLVRAARTDIGPNPDPEPEPEPPGPGPDPEPSPADEPGPAVL